MSVESLDRVTPNLNLVYEVFFSASNGKVKKNHLEGTCFERLISILPLT